MATPPAPSSAQPPCHRWRLLKQSPCVPARGQPAVFHSGQRSKSVHYIEKPEFRGKKRMEEVVL